MGVERAAPSFLVFRDDNPLLPLDDNYITHTDRFIGLRIRLPPSALLERGQDLLPGEFLKVRARMTKTDPFEQYLSDPELRADETIQAGALSQSIPP